MHMTLGDIVDQAKSKAKHIIGAQDRVESAQDAAENEVRGPRQGTDHSPQSAGDADDHDADSAKYQAGASGQTPRKSAKDNRLVSGGAPANDPARGTLREDELV